MAFLKTCRVCKFFTLCSIVLMEQLPSVTSSKVREKNVPILEDRVKEVCRRSGTEEHCYFVEKYTFQANWDIQDLVSKCKDHVFEAVADDGCMQILFVSGLAIETFEEKLFIADFINSYSETQLEVYTSGYWSCKLDEEYTHEKNFCGVWQGWNSSIDTGIFEMQCRRHNCSFNNGMLYFFLEKVSDGINWKIGPKNSYGSNYIACEYIIQKDRNCSTTVPLSSIPNDSSSVETYGVSESSMVSGYPNDINTCIGTHVEYDPMIDEECVICMKMDDYGYEWRACSGETCNHTCPTDAVGYATWRCGTDGIFENEEPGYTHCHHKWIADLEIMVEQKKEVSQIIDCFLNDSAGKYFFGHEIAELADLLYNVSILLQNQADNYNPVQKADFYEDMIPKLANITNNIIKREHPWKQIDTELRGIAGSSMQEYLFYIGFTLIDAVFARDNNEIKFLNYTFSNLRIGMQLTLPNQSTNQLVINYPKYFIDNAGSISVYGEIKAKKVIFPSPVASVGTIIDFRTGNLMFPGKMKSLRIPSQMVLNSAVISFDVKGLSYRNLGSSSMENENGPLEIRSVIIKLVHSIAARGPSEQLIRRDLFPGESPTAVISKAHCVFWNDSYEFGLWDKSGCKMTYSNETLTQCNCSHLSSFGIFMSIHKYENKGLAMELISGISSGLSIICLVLTLVVFKIFGTYLQGERETICRNVCSCLLFIHILSLSVLDKTYFNLSDTICSLIGAILHYLLSAGFFWMAAEGHHLYRLILRVMDGTGRDFRKIYYILSYGVSFLVVGLTAIIGYIKGEKAYGNPELCWLSVSNYQWSFISEALLISLVNGIVLTLSLKAAVAVGAKSALKKMRTWLHGWFTLSTLLGITWFIGIATFNLNVYFEYFFVALNGMQGVWIFLSRVLQNEQIRNIVKKRWKKWTLLRRFYKNPISGNSSSNIGGIPDKLRNNGSVKSQLWGIDDEPISSSLQVNRTLGDSIILRVMQDKTKY